MRPFTASLSLLGFALAPAALAGQPRLDPARELTPPPTATAEREPALPPLEVRAEQFSTEGPPLRQVTSATSGHVALTPDGRAVVYADPTGLFVAATGGKKAPPRQLAVAAPWFLLSRDGRYAVVPGNPLTRLSLSGTDGKVTLAPGAGLHALSGLAVGTNHVAFIASTGALTVATVDEGTAARMPVETPKSPQCHIGAGHPRAFSDDGTWLLFQHGCDDFELVHPDGTGLVSLGLNEAQLVGGYVVGARLGKGGTPDPDGLRVVRLSDGARWSIPAARYSPFLRAVPGRAAALLVSDKRLVLVDLEAKTAKVLHEGEEPVLSFVEASPDGRRALYATRGDHACAVHQVTLADGKRQRLAQVQGASQCFITPLGAARAVLYAWHATSRTNARALLAVVDLETGRVRQLGQQLTGVGNLLVAGGGVAVTSGSALYVAEP